MRLLALWRPHMLCMCLPHARRVHGAGGVKQLRYSATIPGGGLTAGSMVRWRAVATDSNGWVERCFHAHAHTRPIAACPSSTHLTACHVPHSSASGMIAGPSHVLANKRASLHAVLHRARRTAPALRRRLEAKFPAPELQPPRPAATATPGERYYGTVVGGVQYEVQAPGVPVLEW